ncbi:Na+/H+ antiporter family protein [Natranaerobius trueperi]|uniref:Sodium:proton antiporter n=1 Tax=Natranaerobius trueperi TaxID=759412 RepID=A0A226C0T2_9FIRM|nr:Na+/H+ antiporter NhaC family protein [Natranaerobius trueperi]OWZ84059.1 sodium:proton antiporter [Natranaerobius trueperi]
MLLNPVFISVAVMLSLSLLKLNVIIALLVAALVGGYLSGIGLSETMEVLVGGMNENANTALSYILLGALAVSVQKTGLINIFSRNISNLFYGKKLYLVVMIALIASLSQNIFPVHIAFIPILIPPLLSIFDNLKLDRRAVSCALTYGLKAPYVALPFGYGLIFHETIFTALEENGLAIALGDIPKALLLPVIGMTIGLFIAIFITYRKERDYGEPNNIGKDIEIDDTLSFNFKHAVSIIAMVSAIVTQYFTDSLPLGALFALFIMFVGRAIKWNEINEMLNSGITMMGYIAFVMLVASGYSDVLRETGGLDSLVESYVVIVGGSQAIGIFVLLIVGLFVTMGIGTSFGTVPILASLYVPFGLSLELSPMAITALVGTAGALGDAGSPASDSTLGPTAGLSADKKHDHIWDTCVPTFIHFNIPLMLFGWLSAMIF